MYIHHKYCTTTLRMRVNIHSTNMHNDNFIILKKGRGALLLPVIIFTMHHMHTLYVLYSIHYIHPHISTFKSYALIMHPSCSLFCSLTIIPSVKIFYWQQLFQVQNQCIFLKHNTILAISKAQVANHNAARFSGNT